MRADLLLAQPNTGRGARVALRASAGVAGVYGVAVALLFWNMNATLKREQAALKTTRQKASEGRAARRRKREEAAHMGVVHVAPPSGSGSAEFTEELYRLASASGVGMLGVLFPTSGPGAAPPPPPAGDNASANNGGNGNNGNNGNGSGGGNGPNNNASTADANGDDGWKRAPFECNLMGSFPALEDFLERLTRLPRVVEISGLEFHRDRIDPHTGLMRVHLKLTGVVFGQGGKPMKTTTKNNPVQVGALLGVLGATLFFLMKQMGGGNAAAVTLTPVADTPAADAPKLTAAASQGEQRDPFDHPALRRLAKDGMPAQNLTPEAQAAQEAARMTPPGSKVPISAPSDQAAGGFPILPDRTQSPIALPGGTGKTMSTVGTVPTATAPSGPKSVGSNPTATAPEADDPLKGWRLTAIIAGQSPRAVIEGVGTGPLLVGVGGRVRALQVTAIQEREIVLRDALHLYTLPLLAAPATPEENQKENKDGQDSKDSVSASL